MELRVDLNLRWTLWLTRLLLRQLLNEHAIVIVPILNSLGLLSELIFFGQFFDLEVLRSIGEGLYVQRVRVLIIHFVLAHIVLFKFHILDRALHLSTLTLLLLIVL